MGGDLARPVVKSTAYRRGASNTALAISRSIMRVPCPLQFKLEADAAGGAKRRALEHTQGAADFLGFNPSHIRVERSSPVRFPARGPLLERRLRALLDLH